MPLTPEAKRQLSATIRSLRERLLRDLRDAAESHYRLSVSLKQAGLDEAHRKRRTRLEAWLEERVRTTRPKNDQEQKDAREHFFQAAVKEAAATLLNRLVLIRHMEALGLSKLAPTIVTGGWNSKGYRELREFAPALTTGDETEGYQFLLQLLFDELALDLPGLFGDVGLTRLIPIPASTLREVIDQLDDPGLASAWTDDTTLGWVYQYWNDPEREALDAKISDGGKIEPHELASKTQMFTERYMVEWLLHNSLGLTWLCICRKHGWKADVERVLSVLDARRADWRKKREKGEVPLDGLMPIEGELEEQWKYFVPQPIPEDAVEKAPDSIRLIKILDPACGSGHFLVIAFDLLAAMYREEARHRGETISEREIAESILENNLFGVDIDPRSVQIAAAGLFLKARSLAKDARPRHINLVAPALNLAKLPSDDPALVQLRRDIREETGIPEELTNRIVTALAGVDHLGTLLKVDGTVEDAIHGTELEFERRQGQGDLFKGFPAQQMKLTLSQAKASIIDKLEQFLARHSGEEDLGLRLDGEQLTAGVRFIRLVKEGAYDLVVGNPPYQGTNRIAEADYVAAKYPHGKADLYAAFLERGIELARTGGFSALLAMRGWMFLAQFAELREFLLRGNDLRVIGDLETGAFEEIGGSVVSVSMTVFRKSPPQDTKSVAIQPTLQNGANTASNRTGQKRAGLLIQANAIEFNMRSFEVIPGEPIVYWWSQELLKRYAGSPKLGSASPARFGVNTGNNTRFLRNWWEVSLDASSALKTTEPVTDELWRDWVRFLKGSAGISWIDPCDTVGLWRHRGLEMKLYAEHLYSSYTRQIRNESVYFSPGIAFTKIGSTFSARAHRYRCIIESAAPSVYPQDIATTLCVMNAQVSREILQSLNPTVNFQVGDVNRLPVFPIESADEVYNTLLQAFAVHEATRENSVEFKSPGASPWRYAQEWAQRAIDRPPGESLPLYSPIEDPPRPESFISFALGVALGRFAETGEGILKESPTVALPHGILFLSAASKEDSLSLPACSLLEEAWEQHGAVVGEGDDLRTYLRTSFFAYHKGIYQNRPIYLPLSSEKKSFVAWISLHRWADDTLQTLLADYLLPERRKLEGELDDLRHAKAQADKAIKGRAEKRFSEIQKLLKELVEFINGVADCAENGPPEREVDARFALDPDDGVMVNSAGLWKLLEAQWKDPRKWWKELAAAQGRKSYDWSQLAARYFPSRVKKRCYEDPSLAVAHRCVWKMHPAKAFAWELRLQDEIRSDFTINEPGSDEARERFIREHSREVEELIAAERVRRERKLRKQDTDEASLPFEEGEDDEVRAANE